ncbi:uncharacterized protein KZ484_015372 isoform 2-T2 [Pholidichthys leucotaenia]
MIQTVQLIMLLLVHCATESHSQVQANCNELVLLECPVVETRKDFLAVAWYKVINETKHGIIRKTKDQSPQHYNFLPKAKFVKEHSLLLPEVSLEDAGTYECAVSANVGGKNQNHEVTLKINDCVPELTTKASLLSTTQCVNQHNYQIQDLPVIWTITAYVSVAIIKTVLWLIVIGDKRSQPPARIKEQTESQRWRPDQSP